jgi:serralysin
MSANSTTNTAPRFGLPGDGIVTTILSGGGFGTSLALQTDGKILVAGTSNNSFALARYNNDGSLDISFSGDGTLTTAISPYFTQVQSIALQADGKILVAGNSRVIRNNDDFALVRYNSDGSMDTSFSGDGMLTTDITESDYGKSVVLQTDGKILVAGNITTFISYNNGDTIRHVPAVNLSLT